MSRRPRRVAPSAPSRTRARRLAALCFGKDKPAEFQNKIFLGRNMRAPTHNKKADKQCRRSNYTTFDEDWIPPASVSLFPSAAARAPNHQQDSGKVRDIPHTS